MNPNEAETLTSSSACGSRPPLLIGSPRAYAEALRQAAAEYNKFPSQGRCVDIAILNGPEELKQAASQPGESAPVAVVVPGPNAHGIATTAAAQGKPSSTVVARTLGVVAVPEPLADDLGWPDDGPSWAQIARTMLSSNSWREFGHPEHGDFIIGMADPQASASSRGFLAGLAATAKNKGYSELSVADVPSMEVQGGLLGLVRQAKVMTKDQHELLDRLRAADNSDHLAGTVSAVVLDEQAVRSFNAEDPKTRLRAFYPKEGAYAADVTYVAKPATETTGTTAKSFAAYLTSPAGQSALKDAGLRGVDGSAAEDLGEAISAPRPAPKQQNPFPSQQVHSTLERSWQRVRNPGRFFLAIDVSGSMKYTVPGTDQSRLSYAQNAAVAAITLMPPTAEIGLWEFSTNLDEGRDYRELVPIGQVSEKIGNTTRLELLRQSLTSLQTYADTGMYDTALALFREAKRTYKAGEPNLVILISDGRNDDDNSMTIQQLVATLKREQDPSKPVRFLTLAYGEEADAPALAEIAKATGGTSHQTLTPQQLVPAIFGALLRP